MKHLHLLLITVVFSFCTFNLKAQSTKYTQVDLTIGSGSMFNRSQFSSGANIFLMIPKSDVFYSGFGVGLEYLNALEYLFDPDHSRNTYTSKVLIPVLYQINYSITDNLFTAVQAGIAFDPSFNKDKSSECGPMLAPQLGYLFGNKFYVSLGGCVRYSQFTNCPGGDVEFLKSHPAFSLGLHVGCRF